MHASAVPLILIIRSVVPKPSTRSFISIDAPLESFRSLRPAPSGPQKALVRASGIFIRNKESQITSEMKSELNAN